MARDRWYKDMVFYQIWPRSFYDGNGDGMGDLWGVYKKLDYLKSLVVDGVWFSPLYPSPGADCGYDIADYMDIDPMYGGMEAFRKVLDGLHERGMKLIAEFELSALLVTRSEQGMTLLQPGRPPLHMPTQAQEVYDVTGAGDTVIGVLAATLASGNTLEEACYFANAAAGVVVGKLGTSTVSPVELENAVRGRAETGFGVMSEEELK